ncbi:MAG: chalcone isomerase family protein [Desulfatibacillaceae bacterium]|nr:chalcone isomerase family protein [Desulfatibacillaceae bacterium]
MRSLCLPLMLAIALAFVAPCPAQAVDLDGITIPDTLTHDGHNLILNGAGWRTRLWMKIYACALFLPEKNSDAKAVIEADEPSCVRMHFVYKKVSKDTMMEMLLGGFQRSTGGNTAPIADRIEQLASQLPDEILKGDVVDLMYIPGRGIVCYYNGKYRGESPGLDYKQAVFGIWLGDDPISAPLRQTMLGN